MYLGPGQLGGCWVVSALPGYDCGKIYEIIIIYNVFHKYIKYWYSSTHYVPVLQLYQGVCNNIAVQYLYA